MIRLIICIPITGLLLWFGKQLARPDEPKTPLVREVETAGAGNLNHARTEDIISWFEHRRAFADHIAGECNYISEHVPVRWGTTLEGRVCIAAAPIAAQDRLFGPGHFTAAN